VSEVALQIGGRTYRVACATGEEERVTRLGATIADKLAAMGNPTGPDAQNLLFAALLLADEVQEARDGPAKGDKGGPSGQYQAERDELTARVAALESEQARLQSAQADAAGAIAAREAEVAALEKEVAELSAAGTPAHEVSAMGELAPALEQFAAVLEECADKLEQRAPGP
jgi:cell division protein ZapA